MQVQRHVRALRGACHGVERLLADGAQAVHADAHDEILVGVGENLLVMGKKRLQVEREATLLLFGFRNVEARPFVQHGNVSQANTALRRRLAQ